MGVVQNRSHVCDEINDWHRQSFNVRLQKQVCLYVRVFKVISRDPVRYLKSENLVEGRFVVAHREPSELFRHGKALD